MTGSPLNSLPFLGWLCSANSAGREEGGIERPQRGRAAREGAAFVAGKAQELLGGAGDAVELLPAHGVAQCRARRQPGDPHALEIDDRLRDPLRELPRME